MKHVMLNALVLGLAAVGPNIFPAALAGHSTMPVLATRLLLPSIVVLFVLVVAVRGSEPELSRGTLLGATAGAIATFALEIVRLIGFHFDYMPGNLPRLMGVLLLDRFAAGPSFASDIAGWTYHFWNGAAFGIIYALAFGTRRRWVGARRRFHDESGGDISRGRIFRTPVLLWLSDYRDSRPSRFWLEPWRTRATVHRSGEQRRA